MFQTVKRIIDWCGEFKGKLYAGFVMTFFSHIFTAMPLALAAYTIGLLIESVQNGTSFDTSWIWKSILIQVGLVFFRFLFDYFRARLQEPIGYQLTARDRLAVGDALKRVSLGYFQQVSTGNILNSITTGLSTLEGMGIRMIDNFVGGYLNFLVIFLALLICSPVTSGQSRYDRGNYRICKRTGCCEVLWKNRCSHGFCQAGHPRQQENTSKN